MGNLLLGIDCGLTVTKAAVFTEDGSELGMASAAIGHESPHPRWIERDMNAVWINCARVVREALAAAGAAGSDIAAIGVTGHGDGLYLVDGNGRPVRPAILSMDSRAIDVLERRSKRGLLELALPLTGQIPFPGSSAALLAWAAEAEPESLARARYVLGCKDWIKLKLTGEASTDPTDASATFPDVRTQSYSIEALRVYGLDGLESLLPPVIRSTDIAGWVTAEASEQTGLAPKTPVISGLHDVDACAIGVGAIGPGELSIIAGSFSINQTVADHPIVDGRWLCRSFINPGQWLHLGVSPASASNLEWFVSEIMSVPGQGQMSRDRLFDPVEHEVQSALGRVREVWYLPFLYGSPLDNNASAAFVGVRGWHSRADLARALFEGVVFNHLWHIRALASKFTFGTARLTGGGSRSATWGQMFADAVGLPVAVTASDECGVLGSALCAATGTGRFASIQEAVKATVKVRRTFEPRQTEHESLVEAFDTYSSLASALGPIWRRPTP